MSKQTEIRWRKNDLETLKKANRNRNAKINREAKKNPDKAHLLPEKKTFRELKAEITTRADYNRVLAETKQYTARHKYELPKQLEKRATRVLGEFNKTIDKLERQGINKNALPKKMTVARLRDIAKSPESFRSEINVFEKFLKKGNQKLVTVTFPGTDNTITITKFQHDDMLRRAEIINAERRARRERIADIDMTSRGESLGYKRGQIGDTGMGSVANAGLKDWEAFTPGQTRSGTHYKYEGFLRESQPEFWDNKERILRLNYINELKKTYSQEIYKDRLDTIINNINSMSFDEFYKIFEAEGGNFEQALVYKPEKAETDAYVSGLERMWGVTK